MTVQRVEPDHIVLRLLSHDTAASVSGLRQAGGPTRCGVAPVGACAVRMETDDPGGGGSSLPALAVSTDLASQHHGSGHVLARSLDQAFRNRVEIVAMDGFAGYKTAAVEAIDAVTTVMDPFHVVALVEAYQADQPAEGKKTMARLITSIHSGVPAGLEELRSLGQTMKHHRDDILAFFNQPSTSNGSTEAVNGLLEHLRGTAKDFRNIVTYITRRLLNAGRFKPLIHSLL